MRRTFLIKKGDATMALDDVAAIQALNDLDEAGMTEIVADLAKAHDDEDELDKAFPNMTAAEKKRLVAAKRILGPKMKKYLKTHAEPDGDEEDEEPDGDEGTLKRKRARAKARKAKYGPDQEPEGEEDFESTPAKFHKSADGEYDLSEIPEAQRPAVLAILTKADEDRERLAKAEANLSTMLEKEERQVFIRKAAGMQHLPDAKADDLAEILRKTSKTLSPAQQTKLESVLTKADTVIAKSALFGEIGSAVTDESMGDPEAELAAKAEQLQKSEQGLSITAARAKVLKSVDHGGPELLRRIEKAHDKKIFEARRGV